MDTDLRPLDHEPEPTGDDVVDLGDVDDVDDVAAGVPPSLRELEPDWEAAEADVLDQHRGVPLDDDR